MVKGFTRRVFILGMAASASLISLTTTCPAGAMDRHVQVVNETHNAVTGFYASDAGSSDWEDDILRKRSLPPGYQVRINLEDGSNHCRFDFKTEFSDGTTVIRRDVNVCALTRYTLTE